MPHKKTLNFCMQDFDIKNYGENSRGGSMRMVEKEIPEPMELYDEKWNFFKKGKKRIFKLYKI